MGKCPVPCLSYDWMVHSGQPCPVRIPVNEYKYRELWLKELRRHGLFRRLWIGVRSDRCFVYPADYRRCCLGVLILFMQKIGVCNLQAPSMYRLNSRLRLFPISSEWLKQSPCSQKRGLLIKLMLRNLDPSTLHFLLDEFDEIQAQMILLSFFIRFNQQTVTQIFHFPPFPAATSFNTCVLHPFFHFIMMKQWVQSPNYPQP
jgi:hypothetical protein